MMPMLGLAADRPLATRSPRRMYVAVDTNEAWISDGTDWIAFGGEVGGDTGGGSHLLRDTALFTLGSADVTILEGHDVVFIDTLADPRTALLPIDPPDGTTVRIIRSGTYDLTVDGQGEPVQGGGVIAIDGGWGDFTYDAETSTWLTAGNMSAGPTPLGTEIVTGAGTTTVGANTGTFLANNGPGTTAVVRIPEAASVADNRTITVKRAGPGAAQIVPDGEDVLLGLVTPYTMVAGEAITFVQIGGAWYMTSHNP